MFPSKIIYEILIVAISGSLIHLNHAAPAAENNLSSSSGPSDSEDVVYDQRQNGTENLRIHMNDVTLVIAPSEGILQLMGASAADILTNGDLTGPGNSNVSPGKPSTSVYAQTNDCATDSVAKCKQQPHKKNRLRLSSFLVPLLNRATGN